jgi:hypothetical protein
MESVTRLFREDLGTCIHCDVANHGSMVRKSDVLGVMATTIGAGSIGRGGLLVNYEGALNIDLHRARMNDRTVYFGCVREGPRSLCRYILRRGVAVSLRQSRRHDEKESSGGL